MASRSPVDCRSFLLAVLGFLAIGPGGAEAQASRLSEIELPDGFSIGMFASGVTGARSLAQSPGGTVFVGTRDAGVVHALVRRGRRRRGGRAVSHRVGPGTRRTAWPSATEVSTWLRSAGSSGTTASRTGWTRRRGRSWSRTGFRPTGRMAGSSSASGRTGGSTCPWALPATSVTRPTRTTRSCGWTPLGARTRSLRGASETPWASTGIR